MISVSASFSVSGENYSEILNNVVRFVSDLFEVDYDDSILESSKFNFEINIQDLSDSTEFEDKPYKADVIVKVRNV